MLSRCHTNTIMLNNLKLNVVHEPQTRHPQTVVKQPTDDVKSPLHWVLNEPKSPLQSPRRSVKNLVTYFPCVNCAPKCLRNEQCLRCHWKVPF